MTCVVSRRVRIPKAYIDRATVEADLVLRDTRDSDFGLRPSLTTYQELSQHYLVPKAYGLTYIKNNNLPSTSIVPNGSPIQVSFRGTLRDAQVPVVQKTISTLLQDQGAVLNLYCGFGKTTCANMVSCRLGLKTLVLVHTSALAQQWKERIQQFVEGSSVGIIQQNTFDIDRRTHVIALMQTISKRVYEKGSFESFGLMIVDECHHVCAEQLSKCIAQSGTRYRLGLSATPYRKDGFHPFLWSSIGKIAVTMERSADTQDLRVEAVLVTCGPSTVHVTKRLSGRSVVNMSRMVSDLCDAEQAKSRTSLLLDRILLCVQEEERHVIVLSDRRQLLFELGRLLGKTGVPIKYMMGGGQSQAQSKACARPVVLATYSFTSEGVDIPSLDTAVFATPRADVVQTTGRILRQYAGKKTPLVVDFVDAPFVFKNQFKKRQQYYASLGGVIEYQGLWKK